MGDVVTAAWLDLYTTERAVTLVILILAVAALLALAMWLGYNLYWLSGLLGYAVECG